MNTNILDKPLHNGKSWSSHFKVKILYQLDILLRIQMSVNFYGQSLTDSLFFFKRKFQ